MKMRYSKSMNAFFPEEVNYDDLPGDLIAVTEGEYRAAQNAWANNLTLDVRNGKLVVTVPAAAKLLQKAKGAQSAQVSAACTMAILNGFQSSALGAPHTYPSSPTDQANLTVLAVAAEACPDRMVSFWCADAAGKWAFEPHTADQIKIVQADSAAALQAHQAHNQRLQAAIADAKTVEAVQAVTWGVAA